jgi:hypothetical protein
LFSQASVVTAALESTCLARRFLQRREDLYCEDFGWPDSRHESCLACYHMSAGLFCQMCVILSKPVIISL